MLGFTGYLDRTTEITGEQMDAAMEHMRYIYMEIAPVIGSKTKQPEKKDVGVRFIQHAFRKLIHVKFTRIKYTDKRIFRYHLEEEVPDVPVWVRCLKSYEPPIRYEDRPIEEAPPDLKRQLEDERIWNPDKVSQIKTFRVEKTLEELDLSKDAWFKEAERIGALVRSVTI